jgi:hypothetical protein
MDAKLGDTVTHWLNVAKKTSLEPLDPGDHNAADGGVCQMIEPRRELGKWLDDEHRSNVIDRIHIVNPQGRSGW